MLEEAELDCYRTRCYQNASMCDLISNTDPSDPVHCRCFMGSTDHSDPSCFYSFSSKSKMGRKQAEILDFIFLSFLIILIEQDWK